MSNDRIPAKYKNIRNASVQYFGEENRLNPRDVNSTFGIYKNKAVKGMSTFDKNPSLNSLQKSRNYINDISCFVNLSYGTVTPQNNIIRKDDPVLTTDTGDIYNQVYGRNVWEQINNEANAWGILRKVPWDITGWRVLTTAGATSGGGLAENAALPATIKPDWDTVKAEPKTVATTFDVSAVMEQLSKTSNDVIPNTMDYMREYAGREHRKLINRMLLTDVDILASNNLESIDRVISSYGEVTNCGITAGDSDIYDIDRDSTTSWADAYVNHNSNTDRDFSIDILDTLITQTEPYKEAGDQYIFLTGFDTKRRIASEAYNRTRINLPTSPVKASVNGIMDVTNPGVEVGMSATYYNDIPIITSNDVKKDTISRIYLINLNYMFIKVLMPTQYYQTGLITNGDPFGLDRLGDEGLYVTMAELIATKFNVHAKARDLK